MTDSNLQNTVPEGAFGIGSKKTDDFTENEKLRNFGIKDIPKALYEQLKRTQVQSFYQIKSQKKL